MCIRDSIDSEPTQQRTNAIQWHTNLHVPITILKTSIQLDSRYLRFGYLAIRTVHQLGTIPRVGTSRYQEQDNEGQFITYEDECEEIGYLDKYYYMLCLVNRCRSVNVGSRPSAS